MPVFTILRPCWLKVEKVTFFFFNVVLGENTDCYK